MGGGPGRRRPYRGTAAGGAVRGSCGERGPPRGGRGGGKGGAGTVPLHKRKGTGRGHLLDSTRELADMGFEARQALGALLETDGDVVRAINRLASAD